MGLNSQLPDFLHAGWFGDGAGHGEAVRGVLLPAHQVGTVDVYTCRRHCVGTDCNR